MKTNEFNKLYKEYENCKNNDIFNNINIFTFANMTQKQKDKFSFLMIKSGCVIRRNQLNDYYVYNNKGIGIKISHTILIGIINDTINGIY